jgi:hypothetical protein
MIITMLKTRRGCDDGFTVRRLTKGFTYPVADMLAHALICEGAAYNAEPVVDDEPAAFENVLDKVLQEIAYAGARARRMACAG